MSTVMKAGPRRCDAVCHNALGEKCCCICGAKFHGCSVSPAKKEALDEVNKILREKAVAQVEAAFVHASLQPTFDYYTEQ